MPTVAQLKAQLAAKGLPTDGVNRCWSVQCSTELDTRLETL